MYTRLSPGEDHAHHALVARTARRLPGLLLQPRPRRQRGRLGLGDQLGDPGPGRPAGAGALRPCRLAPGGGRSGGPVHAGGSAGRVHAGRRVELPGGPPGLVERVSLAAGGGGPGRRRQARGGGQRDRHDGRAGPARGVGRRRRGGEVERAGGPAGLRDLSGPRRPGRRRLRRSDHGQGARDFDVAGRRRLHDPGVRRLGQPGLGVRALPGRGLRLRHGPGGERHGPRR